MRIGGILAASLAAAALSGCGSDEPPETPAACLMPPSAFVEALAAAPGEVTLDGDVPISGCLVDEQSPGQIAAVGQSLIGAAGELNREIRSDPEPATIVALGYLVGAVQEAAAGTGGIHADLVRRLDTAARFTGPEGRPFAAAFERSFGEGYAAGQASG